MFRFLLHSQRSANVRGLDARLQPERLSPAFFIGL